MPFSRRVCALTALITAIIVVFFSGAAFAASSSQKTGAPPELQVNERTPVTSGEPSRSSNVTPLVTGSGGKITGYHSVQITPPGGTKATLAQGFTSNYNGISCGWTTCTLTVTSGTAYTHWLGSTPYNANSMSLTTRIWLGGTGISINAGTSGSGVGVTVADNGVTMSRSMSNTWRIEFEYYNLKWTTHLSMWGPYQNSSDSATFSYKTFFDYIN